MHFGIIHDFRNPARWHRPEPELYEALLDQIVESEQLGYSNIWLAEHHFTEDGYNPSTLTTAAAIAARTSRIRIGTYILLLPFQHPVRTAEDATCIDILSNGRFDLGVGQGYAANEFRSLHITRRERSARLAEGIELIRRLWTEKEVTFDGRFTQVTDMSLSPTPVQQPHVPIWIGARAVHAIRRVATMGCHLMATIGPDPAPLYVKTLEDNGHDPVDFNIGQIRMVYVAESEDQAWEDVQEHLHYSMQYYGTILAEANDAPGDASGWQFKDASALRHSGFGRAAMIGTPDQVAQKIETFRKRFQCTHFVMGTQLPGLDPSKVTRSLQLFAKEVMPAFGPE